MIIKIKIDEESSLTFDTTDLPKDNDFDSLFEIIKESNLPSFSQFKIAYAYKNEYVYCKKILDHIKTTNIRDIKSKAEIFQMSLDMTHNSNLKITKEYPYNSYYILLGYENIKTKNYFKALVYFSKCQYKLGIELCNFYLKRPCNFTNEILRAVNIFNTKDVINYKLGKEMFKRNVSIDLYNGIFTNNNTNNNNSNTNNNNSNTNNSNNSNTNNSNNITSTNNIDIILSIISKDLSKIDSFNLDNEYFYYLKGKKEHLSKKYEKAVELYKISLEKNYNVYAKYNLLRILQNECINEDFDCYEFNNFKFFMKYKKLKNEDIKCDAININEDIKNFINIMSGIKINPESYITKYKTLLENNLVDKDIIKNNLIYFKYKDILLKKERVNTEINKSRVNVEINDKRVNVEINDKRVNMEGNNKRVNMEDIEILKDIYKRNNSPHVKYNIFYLTQDMTYYDASNKFSVQIENYINRGEIENLPIYEKLTNAKSIKDFKDCLDSFYGANGIGICLAKVLKYKEALKVFYSLVLDYNDVYINIGNVYFLMKEYEKGISEFLKVYSKKQSNHIKYIEDIILNNYKRIKNVDFIIKIYNYIKNDDIRSYICELLIDCNRLEEAECYVANDKSLLEKLNNKKVEKDRLKEYNKKKIEELKNYKKSKNL